MRENQRQAQTGRFLGEKLISDYCLFSSYEDRQGAANGQNSWGFFRDAQALAAGCWVARRLHQPKASTIIDLGISIFLFSVLFVALRNLGLLIKTDWSVICLHFVAENAGHG